MKNRVVNNSFPMHDAVQKAKGSLRYVTDFNEEGMLHGYLVTAEVAHAEIVKIDTTKALQEKGVKAIYTHENIKQVKYNSYRWIEGLKAIDDEMILNNQVRHFGDRVALVVASTLREAQLAAELIEIEYKILPIATNLDAIKEFSLQIGESDNKFCEGTIECGTGQRAFDSAIVVESVGKTQKTQHCAMENHSAVAKYDDINGLVVYSPCQVAFGIQNIISSVCELPAARVRVIKTTTGGSFGGKTQPITELLAGYVAADLKACVSVTFNREQVMTSARTRTATDAKVKTYFSADGKILARDIMMDFDAGGYISNTETVCIAGGKKSFRLYDIPEQRYDYAGYITNTAVSGAFRGYGSPQIHFHTETNMDLAAKQLGFDPVELRLKNFASAGDEDKTGGPNLGNLAIAQAVEKGAADFNWYEKREQPKGEGRYVKGYGMAAAAHGNGYFPAYPDFTDLELKLLKSGEFFVNASIHDQGCGTIVTLSQIVAEELNTDLDNVIMTEADTMNTPFDSAGTQACRVTYAIGKGMQLLAQKFKEEFYEKVATLYEVTSEDVKIVGKNIVVKDKTVALNDLATELLFKLEYRPDVIFTYHSTSNPVSSAVNFAEVEIDRVTGNVKVNEVLSVHDIGKQINPMFCRGQVHGGIQNALGFALSEDYNYNDKGRQINTNFSRYYLFNAVQMPKITTYFIENEEEDGPFGAKSLGEISTIPCTPAIINAIFDATGHMFSELPVTPQKLKNILK